MLLTTVPSAPTLSFAFTAPAVTRAEKTIAATPWPAGVYVVPICRIAPEVEAFTIPFAEIELSHGRNRANFQSPTHAVPLCPDPNPDGLTKRTRLPVSSG